MAIDYIPGCAELGDFDSTSTTIAISPAGELGGELNAALRRTFEKYWENAARRASGADAWDAYTPYELRAVGAFVRLGWRQRAHELLRFFMRDRRPAGWNAWAEVVWHDPRTPKFIGDLPHTWVGSDFIRSVLDMFAYERDADSSLLLGAGIPASWLRSGEPIAVRGLRTRYGKLSYTLQQKGNAITLDLAAGMTIPPGGFILQLPPAEESCVAAPEGTTACQPREAVLRRSPGRIVIR